jgi:hypothetical protein
MRTTTRRIIGKKQWDNLIEKGIIALTETDFGKDYVITLSEEAKRLYTPETVGKIEEKDYQLTSISCTPDMYKTYIMEEPHDVTVDDADNPYEYSIGYYIPEWMFEDRQDDLVKMYKRYGKYEEK